MEYSRLHPTSLTLSANRAWRIIKLTRQILFLLPLIVIFPIFMGIDGVMYAGPIADAAAAIVCGYFTIRELKELTAKDKASNYLTKKITYN